MGRQYYVPFEQVAVAAAQDLLQINGAAGKMLKILRVKWGCTDTTLATSQSVATRCRFLPATVTNGSGGTTPTISGSPGNSAASFTALANNTTKATTSGTPVVTFESGDHLYNGFEKFWGKDESPVVGPSEAFVFELLSTPSGTVHLSGGADVEEIGG